MGATPVTIMPNGVPATPPSPEATRRRVLAVGAGTSESERALRSIEGVAGELGVQLELVPDLPRGARMLGDGLWDAVFVYVSDRAAEDLTWWAEAVRR